MEISDELHTPAASSPGKSPQNPPDRRVGGPQCWSKFREEENVSSAPGIKSPVNQPIAQLLF
jgi:hypothetical protein